jgi:hypothetical protein
MVFASTCKVLLSQYRHSYNDILLTFLTNGWNVLISHNADKISSFNVWCLPSLGPWNERSVLDCKLLLYNADPILQTSCVSWMTQWRSRQADCV